MSIDSASMGPGWYPTPGQAGYQRYWDGSVWSVEVQRAAPPPGEERRPWWQQWWAIVLTLLIVFPFGVVGIWQRKGTSVAVKVTVTVVASALFAWNLATRLT